MGMTPDMFAEGYMPGVDIDSGIAVVGAVLVFLLVLCVICIGFGILCYIFQSLGLHRIAKRRGIRNSWLAWLPIGNVWILGSIADQYRYVAKGQVKNRRKVLLGLTIAIMVLSGLGSVIGFAIGVAAGLGGNLNSMALALLMPVIAGIVSVVASVFQYIAYYDLYCSCDPDDSVLFLVLSILFSVAIPFFVFAQRNKDRGMPPRKDAVVQQTVFAEEYAQLTDEPMAQPEEFEDL